jgi:hypothetical protein
MSKNSISVNPLGSPNQPGLWSEPQEKKGNHHGELVEATGASTTAARTTTDPDTAATTPRAARYVAGADPTNRKNLQCLYYMVQIASTSKTEDVPLIHVSMNLFLTLNVCYFSMVQILAINEKGIVSHLQYGILLYTSCFRRRQEVSPYHVFLPYGVTYILFRSRWKRGVTLYQQLLYGTYSCQKAKGAFHPSM